LQHLDRRQRRLCHENAGPQVGVTSPEKRPAVAGNRVPAPGRYTITGALAAKVSTGRFSNGVYILGRPGTAGRMVIDRQR